MTNQERQALKKEKTILKDQIPEAKHAVQKARDDMRWAERHGGRNFDFSGLNECSYQASVRLSNIFDRIREINELLYPKS